MPTAGHDIAEGRFAEVFDRLELVIEQRWGIPVRIRDVPSPFTGDLDGAEIQIDFDLSAEDALFILIHLFGHTVQWNQSLAAREIGMRAGGAWTDAELAAVAQYEREACGYSLQLLHDAGVTDLDQWLFDFAACDAAYLMHFYKTGEKRPFREFWATPSAPVPARPIPAFTPTRWTSRWAGVVI